MALVHADSLAATLDAVDAALFYEQELSAQERDEVVAWIAARQGLPGAYANMFAPTPTDLAGPARSFTGDPLRPRAQLAHVLGEEACRALLVLHASLPEARAALERATEGIRTRVAAAEVHAGVTGRYCCGTCTVGWWRHLAAGGIGHCEQRLEAGMRSLRAARSGDGRWRSYPFAYTVLALTEIDLALARDELRYAAPALERSLARRAGQEPYAARRHALAERALALI